MSAALKKPLYGWLASEAISLTGTRVSMLAIPLFALEQTGSATRTGLVAFAELVPLVLLKILGGPIIDRFGARRIAITCDVMSLCVVGAIPLLYDAGLLSFPGFLCLVAAAGGLRGPGDGAKQSMIPSLVAEARVPMERATGLSATVERSASTLGVGAAGALVASLGAQNALVIDAGSFGLSAVVLAWATSTARITGNSILDRKGDDAQPYVEQLRQGAHFLGRDRVLLALTVMVAITNMLDSAWSSVLMPVWSVVSGEGPAALGLVLATWSAASAVGAVCAAVWGDRLPRFEVYVIAFLITGLPRFVIFAVGAPLSAILAFFVVGGFASGFLNPVLGAVKFERIPAGLVGRVSSLMTAACFALMPVGGVLGGLLVDHGSLALAMTVVGLAYFVTTMLPLFDRRFREMGRRAPRDGEIPAVEQ